jgi:SAM-dependent methyltransferase
MSHNKHYACLVCGSERVAPLGKFYAAKGLVKCRSCGFVFMERIPTAEELQAHYSQYAYSGEGYLSPWTVKSYNVLLDEFERYRSNGRLLDVGCGRGWFLREAAKRGWEVYGTEYSETAVRLCEADGIRMKLGKLDPSSFNGMKFDVVTSFEVIEHISDPVDEMTKIRSLLRDGGLFYCTTPNFNSVMRYYLGTRYNVIEYPEHLSYYTPATIHRLMKRCGFTKRRVVTTGISLTRMQASSTSTSIDPSASTSADEALREQVNTKWYMALAKRAANSLFTLTGSGMTIKAYYEKSKHTS